jgi:hypothetical protein
MGIMLFLGEMHTSRQKCSRKATQVWLMQRARDAHNINK